MLSRNLIGQSAAHLGLLSILDKVGPTDVEVLISGPTGVGKELYAQHIHRISPRREARFIAVNCGALPSELMENELFGHVGGAFTGARPTSDGLVNEADKGTLFLDEVDSLTLPSQVKLLRFLQEKEYRRLGETKLRRANIRILAATNTNLYAAAQEGRFREDLFFRLRVVPIEVPPLSQRPEDIPLLLKTFIARYAESYRLPRIRLSDEAMSRLLAYSWPGNIRELENCVKYLTCQQSTLPVSAQDLSLLDHSGRLGRKQSADDAILDGPFQEVKRQMVTDFERRYLERALQKTRGNITQAASASGSNRRVFFELMRKHGIRAEPFRAASVSSAF